MQHFSEKCNISSRPFELNLEKMQHLFKFSNISEIPEHFGKMEEMKNGRNVFSQEIIRPLGAVPRYVCISSHKRVELTFLALGPESKDISYFTGFNHSFSRGIQPREGIIFYRPSSRTFGIISFTGPIAQYYPHHVWL